jgi:hypothetical protein
MVRGKLAWQSSQAAYLSGDTGLSTLLMIYEKGDGYWKISD